MRLTIGTEGVNVIRAIKEFVEPQAGEEVLARVPDAINEVVRDEAFGFYEKAGVAPTELTLHQFKRVLAVLDLGAPPTAGV